MLLTSALCLALGAGLVLQSGRSTAGRGDRVGRFFLELMAPLQRTTAALGRVVSQSWRDVAELVSARGENVVLRERTRRLEQELDRLGEVDIENARLRKMMARPASQGAAPASGQPAPRP